MSKPKFSWSHAALATLPFFYVNCSSASQTPKPATPTTRILSEVEDENSLDQMQLLEIINEPLPGGDQLNELRAKRDEHTLEQDELDKLIRLDDAREEVWARKLKAVAELAKHQGIDFDVLYRQLESKLRVDAA